ncbi:MAG: hypothetical protein ABIO82_02090 [Ginsengibacter sp.]
MKLFSFSFVAFFMLLMMSQKNQRHPVDRIDQDALKQVLQKKQLTTISCAVNWASYRITDEEIQQMTPLPGTGSHNWKISTLSDSAQFYFNQGINLYYGFHIIEALPSFKKAQTFDSTCSMLYWGEALAYGPNINDLGYVASPEALTAVQHADRFSNNSTSVEQGLIVAMHAHYSNDSNQTRQLLNEKYAAQMQTLHATYPKDVEVGTLYADALMNLHPWDLWDHEGKAKPWTPEIISLLEEILKIAPQHIGANHYYVHTMEASAFPGKAIKSAEILETLAPGLAHVVHMPSHIYIRTGQYDKGVAVNIAAIRSFNRYKEIFPQVQENVFLYEYHNKHMQAACSMNTADYSQAIKDATDCQNSIDTSYLATEAPLGGYVQYVYMTPELTQITFQKWDEILARPEVNHDHAFAFFLHEFAKGMAYANTNEVDKAKSALSEMQSILEQPEMAIVMAPFNSALGQGTIAKYILMGTIAEAENHIDEAINDYRMGVVAEDSLVYQEPRDWLVPARHYLGNALLKQKKYKEAEKVFLKDMTYQPGNHISTMGLQNARQKN